jgi:hypothetical protein
MRKHELIPAFVALADNAVEFSAHRAHRLGMLCVAVCVVGVVLPPTIASAWEQPSLFKLAQAGSTGGSIGNQNKSVSGGEEKAAPHQHAAKRETAGAARGRGAAWSISGQWNWSAECERGAVHYTGVMTFSQTGNAFVASHGGTNIWDNGTVENGRISGQHVSFDRIYGAYNDHVVLYLSHSGGVSRMSGVLPHTLHSGRCQLSFTKT